jgi:hypothetical protein
VGISSKVDLCWHIFFEKRGEVQLGHRPVTSRQVAPQEPTAAMSQVCCLLLLSATLTMAMTPPPVQSSCFDADNDKVVLFELRQLNIGWAGWRFSCTPPPTFRPHPPPATPRSDQPRPMPSSHTTRDLHTCVRTWPSCVGPTRTGTHRPLNYPLSHNRSDHLAPWPTFQVTGTSLTVAWVGCVT